MNGVKKIFDLNGPFLTFMGNLLWVIITNLVFIVAVIPVVTIGAATKSMYKVMYKIVGNRKVNFFETFFFSFFDKFATTFKLTLASLAVGAVCVIDLLYFWSMGNAVGYAMFGVCVLIAAVFLAFCLCAYPILALRDGTFKETIKDTWAFMNEYTGSAIAIFLVTAAFIGVTIAILLVQYLFMFQYLLFMTFGLNALIITYIVYAKLVLPDMVEEEE